MFDRLRQWFSACSHNRRAQAVARTPTSSKGVLSACLCESYKVKDRMCLMIPVGQLRPGTKGRSGGLNVCLVIAHFATMYYRPVCTKVFFVIDDIIFFFFFKGTN